MILVSPVTPVFVHTSEVLEPGASTEREPVKVVFMDLSYHIQYDLFYSITYKAQSFI